MNTSRIKTFAQELRKQLREGVKQRLLYWGFDEKGEVLERPEPVEGGYTFRGKVYSDETVPDRWKQLKQMIDLHNADYVVEEGAYTWFNRLMAIRILEKNDYIQPQLEYEEGTKLPYLLQNARRGIFPEMRDKELGELKKQLRENRDNEAFARLLTHYCDTQSLISSVFGKISYREDYTELLLPQNLLDQDGILEFIVTMDAITDEDFRQVELIGWLYQYYISEKKDEVFKSFKKRNKAGPEEIPAATQIFTPEWIVRYMVENTVGRLWLEIHPDSPIREKMNYFVEPAKDNPKSEPIIEGVTELTLLDPAAGSGHILVVGFEYLMDMYREEGYTARQAVENILSNNLYGLEIDERAAQLARFAVLLKAAKYDISVLDGQKLPQVYSFPEKTNFSTAEIREFLGDDGEQYVEEFRKTLDLLQHGKNYGSTIKLNISSNAVDFANRRIEELMIQSIEDLSKKELLRKVGPFISVMELLVKKYSALAANPPYMRSGNMNEKLKKYLKNNYPDSKKDLFAVFIEVCLCNLMKYGLASMITQQSWLFLKSYVNLRKRILEESSFESLLQLGTRTFPDVSGEVVQSTAFTLRKSEHNYATYFRYVDYDGSNKKRRAFLERKNKFENIDKRSFRQLPEYVIAFWAPDSIIKAFKEHPNIGSIFDVKAGVMTGNDSLFLRYWYEVDFSKIYFPNSKSEVKVQKWFFTNKQSESKCWFGNPKIVIDYYKGGENYEIRKDELNYRLRDTKYYFKPGITWSDVGRSIINFRYQEKGLIFHARSPMIFSDQIGLVATLNSSFIQKMLELTNPTLTFNINEIKQLPYLEECVSDERIIEAGEKCINVFKYEWEYDELNYNFRGNPVLFNREKTIKKSVFVWYKKITDLIRQVVENENFINKLTLEYFDGKKEIDIKQNYILPFEEEIKNEYLINSIIEDSEIDFNNFKNAITLKKLISYLVGCAFGRFKLGDPGIYLTDKSSDLDQQYEFEGNKISIDEDFIIPNISGDNPFSDDLSYKVKELISFIWGNESLVENLNYLKLNLDKKLEDFISKDFWNYHLKVYENRPIYWLFSSSRGAFKVLVYMHCMDKYTAQKVRQNYLHPYIDFLRREIDKLDSKDSLNSDEKKRLDQLRSNLAECVEYDEVIKEVADKQIEFDLDDGVQHNYKLFGNALAKI